MTKERGLSGSSSLSSRAAVVALVLLLLSLVAWIVTQRPRAVYEAQFTPELLTYHPSFDSLQRQWAHRVLVLSIPALLLVGPWLSLIWVPAWIARLLRFVRGFGAIVLAIAALAAVLPDLPATTLHILPEPSLGHFTIPSATAYLAMVFGGLAVFILFAASKPNLDSMRARWVLWFVIAGYILVAVIPGLASDVPAFPASWRDLLWMDVHYDAFFGDGLRIAQGQVPFVDFRVFYGLLRPALVAAWIHTFGLFDWGDAFRATQWLQAGYVGLVAVAYLLWRPKDPLLALFALLMIVPWVHPLTYSIGFPNHSGLRHLGIPIAVIALLLARRWPLQRSAWWLGFAATLLLLFNPESGIAAVFGFVIFLLHRTPSLGAVPLFQLGWRFAASGLIALAAFAAFFFLVVGRLPPPGSWPDVVRFILDNASGFAGRPWEFSLVFVLIAAHSLWGCVRLAIRRASRPAGPETAFLAGMAALCFAWLAYFVNGPSTWMLWSTLFPYSFLAASSILNRQYLGSLGRSLRPFDARRAARLLTLRPLAFAVVLAPAIAGSNWNLGLAINLHVRNIYGGKAQAGTLIAGVRLPGPSAEFLARKAAFLKKLDKEADGRLIYLTSNALTMPLLTGRPSGVWARDPFYHSFTPGDYKRLIDQITASQAQFVAFDEPPTSTDHLTPGHWYPDAQRHFLDRLKSDIAGRYRLSFTGDGWEVWVRTPGTDR